eukprot:5311313-Pyramimonas_sp.AAC.1
MQSLFTHVVGAGGQRAGGGEDMLENLTLLHPRRGGGRPSSHRALPPRAIERSAETVEPWQAVVAGGQRAPALPPLEEGTPPAARQPPAADGRDGGSAELLVPGAPQMTARCDSSGKKKKRKLKDH